MHEWSWSWDDEKRLYRHSPVVYACSTESCSSVSVVLVMMLVLPMDAINKLVVGISPSIATTVICTVDSCDAHLSCNFSCLRRTWRLPHRLVCSHGCVQQEIDCDNDNNCTIDSCDSVEAASTKDTIVNPSCVRCCQGTVWNSSSCVRCCQGTVFWLCISTKSNLWHVITFVNIKFNVTFSMRSFCFHISTKCNLFHQYQCQRFRALAFASICTFTESCSVKCVGLVCEFFCSSITVGVQVLVELDFFIEEKKERGVYEGGESDADEDKPVLVWIIFRYLFTFQRKWNLKSWVFILSF